MQYQLLREEFTWYLEAPNNLKSSPTLRHTKQFKDLINQHLLSGKRANNLIWQKLANRIAALILENNGNNELQIKLTLKQYITKLLIKHPKYLTQGAKLHHVIDNLALTPLDKFRETYTPVNTQFLKICQEQKYSQELINKVLQPGIEALEQYASIESFRADMLDRLHTELVRKNNPFKLPDISWHANKAKLAFATNSKPLIPWDTVETAYATPQLNIQCHLNNNILEVIIRYATYGKVYALNQSLDANQARLLLPGQDGCYLEVLDGQIYLSGIFFEDCPLSLTTNTDLNLLQLSCYSNLNFTAKQITNHQQLNAHNLNFNSEQLIIKSKIQAHQTKCTAGKIEVDIDGHLKAQQVKLHATNKAEQYSIIQQGTIESATDIEFSGQGLLHTAGKIAADGKVITDTNHLNLQAPITSVEGIELMVKDSFDYQEDIFQSKQLLLKANDGLDITTPLCNPGGDIAFKLQAGGSKPLNIAKDLKAAAAISIQAKDYQVIVGDKQQQQLASIVAGSTVDINAHDIDHAWGQTYGHTGVTMQSTVKIKNGDYVPDHNKDKNCTIIPGFSFKYKDLFSNGAYIASSEKITFITPLVENKLADIYAGGLLDTTKTANMRNLSGHVHCVGDPDFSFTVVENNTIFQELRALINCNDQRRDLVIWAAIVQQKIGSPDSFATISVIGKPTFDHYIEHAGMLYASGIVVYKNENNHISKFAADSYRLKYFGHRYEAAINHPFLHITTFREKYPEFKDADFYIHQRNDQDQSWVSYWRGHFRTVSCPTGTATVRNSNIKCPFCNDINAHVYSSVEQSSEAIVIKAKYIDMLTNVVAPKIVVPAFQDLQIGLPIDINIKLQEAEPFNAVQRLIAYTGNSGLLAIANPITSPAAKLLMNPLTHLSTLPQVIIRPHGLYTNQENLDSLLTDFALLQAMTKLFMSPSGRQLALDFKTPQEALYKAKLQAQQLLQQQQSQNQNQSNESEQEHNAPQAQAIANKNLPALVTAPTLVYEEVIVTDENENGSKPQTKLNPIVVLPKSYDQATLRSVAGCLRGREIQLLKLQNAKTPTNLQITSYVTADEKLVATADTALIGQRQFSYQLEVTCSSTNRNLFKKKTRYWTQNLTITKNEVGGLIQTEKFECDFANLLLKGATLQIGNGGMLTNIQQGKWIPNIETGYMQYVAKARNLDAKVTINSYIPIFTVHPVSLQLANANQVSPEDSLWALFQAAKQDTVTLEAKLKAITNQAIRDNTPQKPKSMVISLAITVASCFAGPAACNAMGMAANSLKFAVTSAAINASLQTALSGGNLQDIIKSAMLAAFTAGICHEIMSTQKIQNLTNGMQDAAKDTLQSALNSGVGQVLAGAVDGKIDVEKLILSVASNCASNYVGNSVAPDNTFAKATTSGVVAGVIDGNSESGMAAFMSSLATQIGSAAGKKAFTPKLNEQLEYMAAQVAAKEQDSEVSALSAVSEVNEASQVSEIGQQKEISKEHIKQASKHVAKLVTNDNGTTLDAKEKIIELGKSLSSCSDDEAYANGMCYLIQQTVSGASGLGENVTALENINENNIQVASDLKGKQPSKFSSATDTENQQADPNSVFSKTGNRKADSLLKKAVKGALDFVIPTAHAGELPDSQGEPASSSGAKQTGSSNSDSNTAANNPLLAQKETLEKQLAAKRQEFFAFAKQSSPLPNISGNQHEDQRFIPYKREIEKLQNELDSINTRLNIKLSPMATISESEIGVYHVTDSGSTINASAKGYEKHKVSYTSKAGAEIGAEVDVRNLSVTTYADSETKKSEVERNDKMARIGNQSLNIGNSSLVYTEESTKVSATHSLFKGKSDCAEKTQTTHEINNILAADTGCVKFELNTNHKITEKKTTTRNSKDASNPAGSESNHVTNQPQNLTTNDHSGSKFPLISYNQGAINKDGQSSSSTAGNFGDAQEIVTQRETNNSGELKVNVNFKQKLPLPKDKCVFVNLSVDSSLNSNSKVLDFGDEGVSVLPLNIKQPIEGETFGDESLFKKLLPHPKINHKFDFKIDHCSSNIEGSSSNSEEPKSPKIK